MTTGGRRLNGLRQGLSRPALGLGGRRFVLRPLRNRVGLRIGFRIPRHLGCFLKSLVVAVLKPVFSPSVPLTLLLDRPQVGRIALADSRLRGPC